MKFDGYGKGVTITPPRRDRRGVRNVTPSDPPARRSARLLLGLAAVAVMFAAADTYVVVLSLPDMMGSVGLSVDQLQRAAPIVSGFLLGYVAMLPLIGRIADLRGRSSVLVAALVVFAFGSLVTAAAYDLGSLVAGRFLQGVGGGGLVPVTLALVADLYPADRRGVPLGVVGAVQELGSVLGPLYGAVVLAFGTWRDIFWINLAVGLLLAAAIASIRRPTPDSPRRSGTSGRRVEDPNVSDYPVWRRIDWIGLLLLTLTLTGMVLVMRQPDKLVTSVSARRSVRAVLAGRLRVGVPLGVATAAARGACCWCGCSLARRPLVDLRDWWASVRAADLLGAGLLSVTLAGIILAFATADPAVQVFSPAGPWYLGIAAVAAVLFVRRNRRSSAPLVPHGAFARRPAWGAIAGELLRGGCPDRGPRGHPDLRADHRRRRLADQGGPGAGGVPRRPPGRCTRGRRTHPTTAGRGRRRRRDGAGHRSASWSWPGGDFDSLHHVTSSVVLAMTGFGFGLALAPVNAALLASTADSVHGVTSALLVVARMVGMLVGISALTTIGLRRYYVVQAGIPSPNSVCGGNTTRCAAYTRLVEQAGIEQLQAIFLGAAICAVLAGAAAVVLFRGARTRGITTRG